MNRRDMQELRFMVRQVCNNLPGLSVMNLPGCYNFAMELGAAKDRMHGEELEQFALRLVEKYVLRRLRREHLVAIAERALFVTPAKKLVLPDPTDPFGIKAACARAERLGRR